MNYYGLDIWGALLVGVKVVYKVSGITVETS